MERIFNEMHPVVDRPAHRRAAHGDPGQREKPAGRNDLCPHDQLPAQLESTQHDFDVGARAGKFARRLGDIELDAIITDYSELSFAMLEAIRRRELGASFYGMVLLDEPRANAIMSNAGSVLSQVTDPDQKPLALDQLADGRLLIGPERTSDSLWAPDDAVRLACKEFFLLPDAMLVRSVTEYARLAPLGIRPPRFEIVVAEPIIPNVGRVVPKRPSVVVWAPERTSGAIAYHALALIEFHGDVTCVTADGAALPDSTARFAGPSDPHVDAALAALRASSASNPKFRARRSRSRAAATVSLLP